MYTVSVPMVRFYAQHEENIALAKRLGASRIFLCPCRATDSAEARALSLQRLRESIPIYTNAGFEVGVWISTMGHGGDLVGVPAEGSDDYMRVTGLHGVTTPDSFCPTDERFVRAVCAYLQAIVRAGARMIMLDDDFRFSHRGDCGCVCDNHMRQLSDRLGEPIAREDVLTKAFQGGYNRVRQVYYDLLGDTLRNFARDMRRAIDEVDSTVRFGFCAVTSSWDCDGVDAIELTEIMAGQTKPFLRLIGAPYWVNGGEPTRHVQYVAELERMQAKWCENAGIELMTEGDCYPRPCSVVPSAYVEMFDTILRADGKTNGVLKYGIDYVSSPLYETGYADHAEANRAIYQSIAEQFDGKTAVGIHVTCGMKKMLHTVFTDPERQIGGAYDNAFYQTEQLLLTNCSVPMTYEPAPITIAFGENAKYIEPQASGYIIDAAAAEILMQSGVDVGLESVRSSEQFTVLSEEFPEYGETVYSDASDGAVQLIAKDGAVVCSSFAARGADGREIQLPSCVQYENAEGKRFLIYGYVFDRGRRNSYFVRNYMRQKQLVQACDAFFSQKLPAVCLHHPDLYLLAKKKDDRMAVGLWNIFPDAVLRPVIKLDSAYTHIEFLHCSGTLCADRVYLDAPIPAYAFVGFTVWNETEELR